VHWSILLPKHSLHYFAQATMSIRLTLTLADPIDDVTVFRGALSVTGDVVDLDEAMVAAEAVVVVWSEALLAGGVTANAEEGNGVEKESHTLAIGHATVLSGVHFGIIHPGLT